MPIHGIGLAAARLTAAAPFVSEQDLGAGVVEICGMPEGVVRIADGGDADRFHGIRDIEHNAVAGTCTSCKSDGRVDGNVVALVGDRSFLSAFAVVAAFPQAVQGTGLFIGENARAGDDLREFGMR
jgi:hypothetical protein